MIVSYNYRRQQIANLYNIIQMDNIGTQDSSNPPSKPNPFKRNNINTSNTTPPANKLQSFFASNTVPSMALNHAIKAQKNLNVGLDSQQENNPQNVPKNEAQARMNSINRIKQKQSKRKSATSISNNEGLSKLEVKLSISGNLCDANPRQLRQFSDYSVPNMNKTKACLSLADKKTKQIKAIQTYLSRLYLTIQSNNVCLLDKAKKKNNPFKEQEIARLLQGLVFYKPNHKFDILSEALDKHVLGTQVKEIAKIYKLDILKAYYAVKQVYIQQKILSQYVNNFNVKIQKNMLLESKKLIALVGQFLHADKKNLLMIYGLYLGSDKKPSKGGVCYVNEEINLLWANIHMMSNESMEIQQMVFEIYKKYRKYQHVEKYVFLELDAMRIRFETANQQFNNRLVQMSIQKMLEEGLFNVSECKGHYLDLVTFLVNRQTINFQAAIQRLANVNLQLKWFDYFKTYIKDLQFDKNKQQQQIIRACYIYKLCKLFYSKNIFLQKDLEQKLVKLVCINCSIILGLMLIEFMQYKHLKVSMLKMLLKYSQSVILKKQAEDGKLIRRLMPQQYKFESILDLIIDFIQGTFEQFIKSTDLSILQTELSAGRKLIQTYFSSQTPLEIVMYYICILFKFASFQSKIQKNIEDIFKLLKQQRYENIISSVVYYDRKLITKIKDSKMVASHMIFLMEMIQQPLKKAQYIQEWLIHTQRLGLNENFEYYTAVLAKLIVDLQTSTQIQISVHTVQIFLNCFRNSILTLINYHPNHQNLTTKLNLFINLIKLSEWYNMISMEIPESIHLYKSQIKTQLQLVVSRLYDKLTIPGHSMSHKLTIIHQIISSERSYNNHMDFNVSVLSDILSKQKEVSTLQLYGMITQQLKKQKGLQPLEALYYFTQLEQDLAKLLINQIGLHFCSSLKQQTSPSLITIQKMVKLSLNLFSYFSPNFKMQQKQKLKMLFRLIQDRIYLWLKNKKMTANLFRCLFDLMCKIKNSIPYEYHITYMISAKRQKLLSAFTLQHYKKMGLHMLYVLSLRISKKECLVDISNERHIQQLQEQLEVFTQIQINMLTHFGREQNSQSFDQYSQRYMIKFSKVLVQCSYQPLINQVAISLLRKLNQVLRQIILTSCRNTFFKRQKTVIQKYLQSYSNQQRGTYSLNKPFQFLKCKTRKDFNQILEKSLNKLTLNPENELSELQMGKIISFIDHNSQHIIDFVYLSTRLIQSKPIDLLFVQLINKILQKLNPNYYGKKQNRNIIKTIVSQLTSSIRPFNDLYALRLNRQFINTINSVLQNSLLSPFEISFIFSPGLAEMLHNLRQILFKWTPCNIPSLHFLGQISLILSHYPSGTNYNKNFTLWNLVQYRQKLLFIDKILEYAREVNSLFDIKKYGLIQILVEFTTFLALNQPNFQTKQTQQKIAGINKILQSQPLSPNNLINYISKDFSIPQLKQIAWHIVEHLNYLNYEYTSFQAEFFQHFSPNNNQ